MTKSQKYSSFSHLILFFLTFSTLFVNAQKKVINVDTTTNQLSEVFITSILNNKTQLSNSETTQVITKTELNQSDNINYNTILNKVPGVFIQSGTLNTNRITIRGIGARSPFGTTSIRAYFGDIPLTDGNGNSTIEDLELSSFSSIEIHKGPAASSFGVGLGGTIILNPTYVEEKTTSASLQSVHGSFGLQKNTININTNTKNVAANFIYANTESDGYRENNDYEKQTLTASIKIKASEKDNLTILGNYIDLKAFIPSSVDLETFNTSPRSAAFTWGAAQGFEDNQSLLAGLSWEHVFKQNLKVHSSIFTSSKKNYEPRPFNILDEESIGAGARSRLTGNINNKINWGFGGEFFYDKLDLSTFENLYLDFPIGTGSVQGDRLSNFEEQRNYYNIFGEASYKPHVKWVINTGLNINQTSYRVDDLFNNNADNTSGNFNFDLILSPKLGVVFNPTNQVKLKASVSHGFAPPTTEETLLPNGIINTNLEPEKGWNFEVGSQFSFFQNKLTGDLNIYILKITDLLVDRRTEEGELFAINAGRTTNFGIEGNLNYKQPLSKNTSLHSYANFSIYNYTFDTFIDDENDFSGNDLTGVPSGVFNTGISIENSKGFYANINYQHVGRIPVNDENSVFSDSYQLVNTKIGYQLTLYNKFKIDTHFGVNNLFDEKFVSQVQVNAGSFGGNAPRFFFAGNPVNYYGGVNIRYVFL